MTPKYTIALITYFDILGFQDMVKTKPEAEIYNLLMHFKNTSKSDEKEMKEYSRSYNYFSDTIVRSVNVLSEANRRRPDGILFNELYDPLYIINDLILKGVLIRGSVTIGPIFNENDIFFGPGVITAYDLERKAIYPRIIVDSIIVKTLNIINSKGEMRKNASDLSRNLFYLLSSNTNTLIDEKNFILKMLKKGRDNVWFVDYLGALASEYDEIYEFSLFLNQHKLLVEKGIRSKLKNSHVLEKYLWLRRYHNTYVSQLVAHDKQFSRLLINEIPI